MSEEKLLSMDEGALRKLPEVGGAWHPDFTSEVTTVLESWDRMLQHLFLKLEATLDLAERRQIRSAIRELRRQELERDEEALASKRFRTERSTERQENKENWLRSRKLEEEEQQQKSLDLLLGKLESIQDVEELTALLRGASEYEERKLIRAAIRKLRAEEIEGMMSPATLAGKGYPNRRDKKEPLDAKEREESPADGGVSEELAERELIRAQIRELRSEQYREAKTADVPDSASGAWLLLDPVSNQLPSETSSRSLPETGPDPELRAECPQASSHASGSDTDPPPPSEEESPGSTVVGEGSEVLKTLEEEPPQPAMQGPSEALSAKGDASWPKEPLPNNEHENHEGELQVPETEVSAEDKAGDDLRREQSFQRSGSVLERARKFSADPAAPQTDAAPTPAKGEGPSRGARVLQQQQQLLHSQLGADLPTAGRPGRAFQDGARRIGTSGTEQAAKLTATPAKARTTRPPAQGPASPKEAGAPGGRSQSSQWQGGKSTPARQPVENTKSSSAGIEESSVRPGTSSRTPLPSQARSGGANASDAMKTLFTIEIKDGRSQPVRSHVVGMPGSQRAELTLGLRSTPICITTTSTGGAHKP
ncbi:hypothetical protein lerEdw1_003504 [Lerista edwardsae]|nr:hypothetical protein lerEdw1_003504 [Lerista edwardsae]